MELICDTEYTTTLGPSYEIDCAEALRYPARLIVRKASIAASSRPAVELSWIACSVQNARIQRMASEHYVRVRRWKQSDPTASGNLVKASSGRNRP